MAQQVPVDAELAVNGSVIAHGQHALELTVEHFVHHSWHMQDEASLRVEVEDATLVVYDAPDRRLQLHETGPSTGAMHQSSEEPTMRRIENWTGSVEFREPDGKETAFVVEPMNNPIQMHRRAPLDYRLDPVSGNAPWTSHAAERSLFNQCLVETEYCFGVKSGSWMRPQEAENRFVAGDLRAWFYGGVVRMDNGTQRDIRVGHYNETLRQAGPYEDTRRHNVVLFIEAEDARAELIHGGRDSWAHAISQLDGWIDGDLELRRASGNLLVNQTPEAYKHHIIQLRGNLTVAADFSSDVGAWSIEGEARAVLLDTVPSTNAPSREFSAATFVATGILATLAIVSWKMLPRLGTWIGWSRDVWGNGHRRHIARVLAWSPGLAPMDLVRETGLSRASVLRHLNRLERDRIVCNVRTGKIPCYALNSGLACLDIQGTTIRADNVFRAHRDSLNQQILRLAERGSIDYRRFVQEGSNGNRIPRSTFSAHARELERIGMLERRVDGRTVKWRLLLDIQELRKQYLQSFLKRRNWWGLYQQLLDPVSKKELTSGDNRLDGQMAQEAMDGLQALGLIVAKEDEIRAIRF